MTTPCPTEEQMFGYLEHRLDHQMRERVEEHINTCGICRMMVVSLAQSSSVPSSTHDASFGFEATIQTPPESTHWYDKTWDESAPIPKEIPPIDPSDPWIGQTIGRVQLTKRIGEGSFGAVYQAWEPQFQTHFAVKLLQVRANDQKEAIKRFQREARLLAKLQHPNIVEIHDYGVLSTSNSYYLTMEFLQGNSLQEAIDNAEFFPIDRVYQLIQQLCQALAHLHDAGMVHRDIKPANLFVTPNGIKLLDLGLASMFEEQDLTMSGVCLGSPVYMSPEQAAGQARHATPASDLYSLGVILFELLTGARPFQARSRHALMEQHMRSQPPSLKQMCPALEWAPMLEAFIQQTLAKMPTARFNTTPLFWAACSEALQQQMALEGLI